MSAEENVEVKCLYCDKVIREDKKPMKWLMRNELDFCNDECKSNYFAKLEENDQGTIKEILKYLKIVHKLIFNIDDFENRHIAFRNIIRAIDVFEKPKKEYLVFDQYKQDIKEQVIDAEPDDLIECKECNNNEDFTVCISPMTMTLENGTNTIIDLTGETRIHKADDIYFICNKCKKIILDSCMY